MYQIIIEHYKNSCDFISLGDFKIPFIFDNGLYFNEEQVYKNECKKGILINKEEGFWIYYDKNGIKISEENYKYGKQEGLYIEWYENGQKYSEGNYKYGKEEGFLIFWDENGQKNCMENYKNGEREGLCINWYKNGQKESEGNYKYGKQDGLWVYWNKNGKLNASNRHCAKISEETYKNSILT